MRTSATLVALTALRACAGKNFGDAECPCLNVTAPEPVCDYGHKLLRLGDNNETSYFPDDYGTYCEKWDMLVDTQCSNLKPDVAQPVWCGAPWCYVDADKCRKSTIRMRRVLLNDSALALTARYWSYATCNVSKSRVALIEEEFLQSTMLGRLGGQIILGSIAKLEPGLAYKVDENGNKKTDQEDLFNSTEEWDGTMIKFMKGVVKVSDEWSDGIDGLAGMEYQPADPASYQRAKKLGLSVYDASILDVQDGLVDAATGPYWVTADRLARVLFTTPLYVDTFSLFVPREDDKSQKNFWQSVTRVFKPLEPSLWLFIGVSVIVVAFLSQFSNISDEWIARFKAERRPAQRLRMWHDSFWVFLFCACMEAMSPPGPGPAAHGYKRQPKRSAKLLQMGYMAFVVIVFGTWRSGLSAYLTLDETPMRVGGMPDALAKGMRICIPKQVEHEAEKTWPEHTFISNFDGEGMVSVEAYRRGDCDAVGISKYNAEHMEHLHAAVCDAGLEYIDTIMTVPVAIPATINAVGGLSFFIQMMLEDTGHMRAFHSHYMPIDEQCAITRGASDDEPLTPISMLNMAAPIFLLVLFGTISFVVQFLAVRKLWRRLAEEAIDNSRKIAGEARQGIKHAVAVVEHDVHVAGDRVKAVATVGRRRLVVRKAADRWKGAARESRARASAGGGDSPTPNGDPRGQSSYSATAADLARDDEPYDAAAYEERFSAISNI